MSNGKKRKRAGRLEKQFILFSLPALAGFFGFYVIPFIRSIYYSLIENTHSKRFVGLRNYERVLHNEYFQLALQNTLIFSVLSVSSLLLLALLIAYLLEAVGKRLGFLKSVFVMPMVLPTASVIVIWRAVFANTSYDMLCEFPIVGSAFVGLPMYLLFLWKNAGLTILILTSAMLHIPKEIKEAAVVDGADSRMVFRRITLPLIAPELFFAGMLAFVNSLKNFRESQLFYRTNYPPDEAYLLQHYMNNHFLKLDYQILAASTVIFTLMMLIAVAVFYRLENRLSR